MKLLEKLAAAKAAKEAASGQVTPANSVQPAQELRTAPTQVTPVLEQVKPAEVAPNPAETLPPAPSAGFRAPVTRRVLAGPTSAPILRRVVAEAPAAVALPPAEEKAPETAPAAMQMPAAKPTLSGALGAIQQRALARAAGAPPASAVNPAARAAVTAGHSYSAEQFLEDMQGVDGKDWDDSIAVEVEQRDQERAAVLRKGAAYVEDLFSNHMNDLKTGPAAQATITEMARVVKLTFLRVKSAPNAWAMLDLVDKAKIIQAMRAMADNRQKATKSLAVTKAKEYSAEAEIIEAPEPGLEEAMAALGGDFDLGF